MGSNPIASSVRRRLKKVRNTVADVLDMVWWMWRCRKKDRYGLYHYD